MNELPGDLLVFLAIAAAAFVGVWAGSSLVERRAREALVRAGAGFHDDRRTGEAGAAGR